MTNTGTLSQFLHSSDSGLVITNFLMAHLVSNGYISKRVIQMNSPNIGLA